MAEPEAIEQGVLREAVASESIVSERPTIVRYRVMAFLCALSFLTYFDRFCIVRSQKDIQQSLGMSDQQMGWVLGAFSFAYALFEIPSGYLGDRFGPRLALLRIVLAWSLFTALSGTATGFLSLLAFRFLFGVGEAGAYPGMAGVQSRWVPLSQRARLGGLLWLFARWGGAFSPIIIGHLLRGISSPEFRGWLGGIPLLSSLQDVASWRFGFWIAGLFGVIWCVSFYPWFRNEPSESSEVNDAERKLLAEGTAKKSSGHSLPPGLWSSLFSSRSLWAMATYYFCGTFAWSFFQSWMPRYLEDVHKVKFDNSEWMTAAPLFFGGLSCLLGGALCDFLVKRTGRKRLVRAIFPVTGCLTAAVAMYCTRLVHSPEAASVLMCVAAAAYDFGQSANWASIVDIGGRYAGVATGFINMVGNMAGFAQPVIGAYVFNRHGFGALFVVYSAMFLIAATMWWHIDPTKVFYKEEAARI